jgi:outer membrane receptor protein involved in Fe transport
MMHGPAARTPSPNRNDPLIRTRASACAAALLASACAGAAAQDGAVVASSQRVEVTGNYLNAVGTSDAASQGTVTAALIESRPTLRPAEVLEFVPGVIVTQHSGDGKANQYFLRGFNLDHGTDFATWVDGMPVNMPSHAHGQGYSDLNWLIPELVDRIAYRKGPYFADEGDFSSAGAARIALVDTLPAGLASATAGGNGYARTLLAKSAAAGPGRLLGAFEYAHNDGPWDNPERFHRVNGVLRYSVDAGGWRQSLTALGYAASWHSTDQVPLRAVQDGVIGRFGAIDPTDGGKTSRWSLSYQARRALDDGAWAFNAYAIESRLDLFSDFTYFLDDPVDGDQFEQAEHRRVFGLGASRRWDATLAGRESTTTLGIEARQDRVDPVGLYDATAGMRRSAVQVSTVRETSAAAFAENATQWLPWLRAVAGLRVDRYGFDVGSSIEGNAGRRTASIASPKLSLVFGPWDRSEVFVNAGTGFHSNDARGTTEHVTPREREAAQPVSPLARTRGAELGLRTQLVPGLQSSLALWVLKLDSELVFSGDAGDTEASRASLRKGVEWSNHVVASAHVLLDADLSFSHARYTQSGAAGSSVPGSIESVASFGATLKDADPWFGQFQLRWFGPRPLVEDDRARSKGTALATLRAGYAFTPRTKLMLDVFNLFDRKASDIDYFYASRLKDEPASAVQDGIHFHPVEPRSFRLTLQSSF